MITRRKFIGITALAAGAFGVVSSGFNKPFVIAALKN
jgi:hypothetical protein